MLKCLWCDSEISTPLVNIDFSITKLIVKFEDHLSIGPMFPQLCIPCAKAMQELGEGLAIKEESND